MNQVYSKYDRWRLGLDLPEEDVCPVCDGDGEHRGQTCYACGGTGEFCKPEPPEPEDY